MPIGKNAIKRVKNNGYSNVETSAPDMEHSVIASPDPQVEEKILKPIEEKTAKKSTAKKPAKKTAAPAKKAEETPAKAPAAEPKKKPAKAPAKKKTAAKKPAKKEGFDRVELGDSMPYYLL